MTEHEFEKMDQLFNSLIDKKETLEVWNCVDGGSLYSRCFNRIGDKMEKHLIFMFAMYNRLIEEEKYIEAFSVKKFIMSGKEIKIDIIDEK